MSTPVQVVTISTLELRDLMRETVQEALESFSTKNAEPTEPEPESLWTLDDIVLSCAYAKNTLYKYVGKAVEEGKVVKEQMNGHVALRYKHIKLLKLKNFDWKKLPLNGRR